MRTWKKMRRFSFLLNGSCSSVPTAQRTFLLSMTGANAGFDRPGEQSTF